MGISGTHALSSSGISYAFVAFMVFAGTILQSIAVKLFSKRDGFKGFPGTVFPFLCAVLAYLGIVLSGFINLFDRKGKKNGATGNKSAGYNKSKGI